MVSLPTEMQRRQSPPPAYAESSSSRVSGPPPVYSGSSHQRLPNARRIIFVYHEGNQDRRRFRVLDSDNFTVLYIIESVLLDSVPWFRVMNAITNTNIGNLIFNYDYSERVSLLIHDKSIAIWPTGGLTTIWKFQSPSNGEQLGWMDSCTHRELCCVNSDGEILAHFEPTASSFVGDGEIELSRSVVGPLMDEVVVSGIGSMVCHLQKHHEDR